MGYESREVICGTLAWLGFDKNLWILMIDPELPRGNDGGYGQDQ